jgi:plastocyanin
VSRAVAAALTLVLVATLGPIPAGPIGDGSLAAAADCVWQQHSKRIVKQVKRNGRPRRLVRVKRWWSCSPLAAVPAIAAPPAIAAAPGPVSEPESGPTPARLSVKATEFSYTLSRPSIVAGEAIVELNNQGEDPHNLNLELQGGGSAPLEVSEAGPLENRTANFDLAAGDYRLWCSLPEHEEKGMKATLVVTGE